MHLPPCFARFFLPSFHEHYCHEWYKKTIPVFWTIKMKMSGVPEPEIKCAGFLVFRLLGRIEYLLLQASDGIHHWTPPKGHREDGEDLMQAAFRETLEESGIRPEDYDVVKDFPLQLDYIARGKTKRVYYWLAHVKDPNTPVKLSNEHQDYRWANSEAAIKMMHPNMADIVGQCERFLKKRLNL